ncbi:NAD(P)-binding protein [Aaosphaeria arxii CBS 175.79]|uniref:NAD(P)-binding protein n=1 Tax=Aaosphaeria arxii CBS 175.79 TaxID=1450172 RepID=A0A6A5Y1S9_9PLEO|nr:NAD(P)-binding protein [Aaosphaeria arxii CBS 175.79]KAF2019442.1 NAD(P)-binding protein [Aaosphaeria arxii CBS 175.79]
MRVIVFGATGIQGRSQVHHLHTLGHTVVAVSRTPSTFTPPPSSNTTPIESVTLDFTSLSDVDRVIRSSTSPQEPTAISLNLPSTSFNPSPPILLAASNIASSAATHGVSLIVFNTSMPVPTVPQDIKAQDDRREIMRILRSTPNAVPVICIKPVVYLDNLLEGWALPPIRDRNTVVYCHKPTLRVSWICHHDVAQLVGAAIARGAEALGGRDFDVGGPETVRLEELAGKLGRGGGREMGGESQSVAEFCERIGETMGGRGLEGERIVAQMFKAYTYYNEAEDEPFRVDMRAVLEELPVRLTTIEEWARRRSPPGW